MNRKLLSILMAVILLSAQKLVQAQANTTLSNLVSPTAINQNLLPSISYLTIGDASHRWRFIYFDSAIWLKNQRAIFARGAGNFFTGTNAGNFTFTGTNNSAFGQLALTSVNLGFNNTAVGFSSLTSLVTGQDNVSIGYNAMASGTTANYNTAIGSYALSSNTGERNTAAGFRSLNNNTTGSYNAAVGGYALYDNSTGSYNTATGYSSLNDNQTGNYNTATGYYALTIANATLYNTATGYNAMATATLGSYNTANGAEALFFNRGNYNVADGYHALRSNFTGSLSTAVGYYALRGNNAGVGNTAVGSVSMELNSAGNYNSALGRGSLNANTTGSYNTAIGYQANVSSGALSNSTALGRGALATASNQVRIGNASVTSIGGYANWTNISDGRVKKNIQENVAGLSFINRLKAVTYNLDIAAIDKRLQSENKNEDEIQPDAKEARAVKEKVIYTGFIAQDVEAAAKEINYSFSGVDAPKNDKDMYGLRYAEFVVPLVKAVQELSAQNTTLKEENQELKKRIEKIEAMMKINTSIAEAGLLEQNSPNPANGITRITYKLPMKSTSAVIVVSDAAGKVMQSFDVSSTSGTVQLNTNRFAAGTYHYTLYTGNKMVDAKQLVIVR